MQLNTDIALQLKEITRAFGRVVADDIVSFEATRGEAVTLTGPSGCGKTSTLRPTDGILQLNHQQLEQGRCHV